MIPQNWVERGEVERGTFGLKNCCPNCCVWCDDYWLKMDSHNGESSLDGDSLDGDSLDGDSLDLSFVVVPFYFVHWLHWLHWLKMDLAWFGSLHTIGGLILIQFFTCYIMHA